MSVVRAWMMAKSPRMRIMTSCSRMFLTVEPRPIWARKALRSISEPSGRVCKKSVARLASNQATSASSTDRTKFRLSCCSLARCCSLSAMVRLHRVGAIDCEKLANASRGALIARRLGADRFNCRRIGPWLKFLRCRAHDDLVDVDIGWLLDGEDDRPSHRACRNGCFIEFHHIRPRGPRCRELQVAV